MNYWISIKSIYAWFQTIQILFRPSPGEIRQIYIEKSSEPLGITIDEGSSSKGVFVASVSENSLAYQVGLQVNSY